MRIAMVSTPFVSVPPTKYGGTELVVHELVEGLVERGHEVTLYATGDSRTSGELMSLFDVAQWPPDIMQDLNHTSWAMAHAHAHDFDVVHVHSAAALAFSRWSNALPIVYTLHHVRDQRLSSFYESFPTINYVAISNRQAELEIPLARLSIIHHGLDPARYEWRERAEPFVAFIGRFAPEKGPHLAIDAAREAGVRIRVAGETHPVEAAFGAREMEPRLAEPHVTYLGNVGFDRKVPLLRDARALLAPIEWEEPFGLVLIEAMLSGCPVVTFPRGSARELVEEGVTGFIARDRAELAAIIGPGGPLDRFDRVRCRERAVARFSRDRMVAEYERLYQSLVAEPALQVA